MAHGLCRGRAAVVSTLLLTRRLAGGAAAAGGGGALALTLSGSSQSLSYSEPLGVYPDGSARTLFVQFTRTLTNGSPDSGTLTVPGRSIAVQAHRWGSGTASTLVSFAVPLQQGDIPSASIASCTTGSLTDDSATWTNSNSATWYTGGDGIPAGILWPTSATHLCASSPFGPLTPQSGQPSFTGSAAVDTAIAGAITGTVLTWDGNLWSGADYERVIALHHLACRTGDVTYVRMAAAFASRMRSIYWGANFAGLPEQRQVMYSWLWMYLMRRDTGALEGIKTKASLPTLYYQSSSPRYSAIAAKACSGAIKAGLASTLNNYGTLTYQQCADAVLSEALQTGADKLTQTNGRITLIGVGDDGVTEVRSVFPYMAGLYVTSLLDFLDVMPASANKTALYSQLSTSVSWLRTNMASTSSGGTKSYLYNDVDMWYSAVPGTLTSAYTAGSTSISITINPAAFPSGWDAPGGFSANCIVRIAGVSKRIVSGFTTNGSGQATVTLEVGGFSSSYSGGQAITFMRDSAIGPDPNTVDLNGFLAPIFAWRAAFANSVADANEARSLLATIGFTPQDGVTGPYIVSNKQFDEATCTSQLTWAYLATAGI